MALFFIWNYLHVPPFGCMNNKKHKKKKLFPQLLMKSPPKKIAICYYSIKILEIYGIHMYFFFPEMFL